MGSSQAGDGLEHYSIAAYQLSIRGKVSIVNSLLTTYDTSVDGIHARIFVNDADTGVDAMVAPGLGNSNSFNANLGLLNSGDTIYVAIGAGATDFNDAFGLQYQIDLTPVPEPSSVGLLGWAAIGLLGYSWTRSRITTRNVR